VPILIAGTVRDDEPVAEMTTAFVELVRRSGGLELPLRPLAPRDVEPLVLAHLGGDSVEPDLARTAFERSAGNPLFLLECFRAGRDRGWIRLAGARWSAAGAPGEEVPDSVRRLVAARMARLAGPASDLLAAAAELGSAVSFDALAAMLPDLPGGLVVALDDALESGLLQERGTGYVFAHPLYRLAVHESTRCGRRGTFRIAAARALAGVCATATAEEMVAAAATSSDPASVADHALAASAMGVPGAAELAVAFGFEAGDRERRLFDHAAATDLLERTVNVWRHLPPGEAGFFAASTAWTRLAALRLVRGDEAGATHACREAIGTARTPEELASAYIALHILPYRHGDFESGLSILEEGLARLPEGSEPWRTRVQAEIGWVLLRLRRLSESLSTLEASGARLDGMDDRPGAMRALDGLGVVLRMLGRHDESIERLDRSLSLALEQRDSRGELWARIHLCGSLTQAGRPARARPHAERSLELALMMGDRYVESVAAWKAAEMMDALGDVAAAIGLRRRELALLSGIGGNAHNEALAHAHLAVLLARDGSRSEAAVEARLAHELSTRSEEAGYPERIERALRIQDWKDLD
jgi:tetratricopeptide (TPR) repeat protein